MLFQTSFSFYVLHHEKNAARTYEKRQKNDFNQKSFFLNISLRGKNNNAKKRTLNS